MPQCKMSNCREPAVQGRGWGNKRYCQEHGERYVKKQREWEAAWRSLPDCESGIAPDCTRKVGLQRAAAGETCCLQCERIAYELNRQNEIETRKQREFDQAETVEELKQWIQEYMK